MSNNNTEKQESIWSGVYSSFEEAPDTPHVFNSDTWTLKQQHRALEKLKQTYSDDSAIPDGANSKDYPLPTFIALLLNEKPLTVIDFGGAMGQSYMDLCAKIPGAKDRLHYTIVETPALVKMVPEEISTLPNLFFVDDYNKVDAQADIVHIGSTLQYFDDWQLFLDGLIEKFNPRYFILSDLLVGDIPSFVTIQRYYTETIKVRFNNIEEFLRYWQTTNYNLIYKAYFQPFGDDTYFSNEGLPETHRVKKACHMVFSKNDTE